jgi:VanZ family protein
MHVFAKFFFEASKHRGLWVALLTALVLLAFALSQVLQISPRVDKLIHIGAFGTLAFAAYFATGGRLWKVCVTLFLFGFLIELTQSFLPGRSGDLDDLLADVLGIAAGLLCAHELARWASSVLGTPFPSQQVLLPRRTGDTPTGQFLRSMTSPFFTARRSSRLWAFMLFALLIVAGVCSQLVVLSSRWDKLVHLLAFCSLAYTAYFATGGKLSAIAIALLLFGVGIEAVQALAPGHHAEFEDVLADTIGIMLGLLLASETARWARRIMPASSGPRTRQPELGGS